MNFDVNVEKRNAHGACEFLDTLPDYCEPIQAIGQKKNQAGP
jgi:hypothetical protein